MERMVDRFENLAVFDEFTTRLAISAPEWNRID